MGTIADARLQSDESDWVLAHQALSRLARERAAADAEEGRWLLCALRSAAHVHIGCASFSEYVERLFGYKPRTTQEKLRVAEALEGLPHIARAIEAGTLSWCAARELTRVAVADTERAWLDVARGKTIRQLEELVASRSPGDGPASPPTDRPRQRVLRFEVAPETFALFREAMQHLRRSAGGPFDDDAALLSMARHVLAGPGDNGRSSYQVSLTVCSACGSGDQLASGERVPVGDAVLAMAQCDAQLLGPLLPRAANENARAKEAPDATAETGVESHARGARPRDGEDSGTAPGARAHVGVRGDTDSDTGVRGDDNSDIAPAPVATGPAAETENRPAPSAASLGVEPSRRAKQSIPPAMRRAVLARDQHRCRVPGCNHATYVDVHHVVPRSEGGRNEPANLLTLCGAHHRAAHRGEIVIGRNRDGEVSFAHADGTPYGQALAPRRVDAQTKVFSALRHLGFREREIKTVQAELLADDDLRDAPPERLLREALCRIRITRQ
jgi:hypothetical protein